MPRPVVDAPMPHQPWQGELWLGVDFALFCGSAGHASVHRHYAHQGISLLRAGVPGPWQWIASLQAHAVEQANDAVLAVYAEPLAYSLCSLQAVADRSPASLESLAEAMRQVPRHAMPERLQGVLHRLDASLLSKVSAADLAQQAHLSQSHLQRLFDARLGLSIRRMVLWRRLRLALRLALQGDSLTAAAHAAGFADSAHLSRTLRSMFGISGQQNLRHLRVRLLAQDGLPGAPADADCAVCPGPS